MTAPALLTVTREDSPLIVAAKNIRRELAATFPGVRFSVKTDRFAGGDSIDIKWTDGPTGKQVDAITKRYQAGSFDGMIDCYNYDGDRAFTQKHGDAKYVHASRDYSDALVLAAIAALVKEYNADADEAPSLDDYRNGRLWGSSPIIGGDHSNRADWGSLIGRWLQEHDATPTQPRQRKRVGGWDSGQSPQVLNPAAFGSPVQGKGYRIETHHHTKKARDMHLVILAERVERAEWERLAASCKAAGGWYSKAWNTTPGGFAFWDRVVAEEWAATLSPSTPPPSDDDDEPGTVQPGSVAANAGAAIGGRLIPVRTLPGIAEAEALEREAERLQVKIDDKRAERLENTPKRACQGAWRRHEAENLLRALRAIRALAAAHRAGTCPAEYASLRRASQVEPLVKHYADSSGGYYSCVEDREPADKSPHAVAFRAWVEGRKSEEDKAAQVEHERARKIADAERAVRFSPIPGFFPTPPDVIEQMLAAADIPDTVQTHVLEPSAGKGDIIEAIQKAAPNATVHYCEVVPSLKELVRLKTGLSADCADFTEHEGKGYHRIIMNPPFEDGTACKHVRLAYGMLANGGRLVAIMPNNPKSWELVEELGGTLEELPENSFKGTDVFRETGCRTVLVVIDK